MTSVYYLSGLRGAFSRWRRDPATGAVFSGCRPRESRRLTKPKLRDSCTSYKSGSLDVLKLMTPWYNVLNAEPLPLALIVVPEHTGAIRLCPTSCQREAILYTYRLQTQTHSCFDCYQASTLAWCPTARIRDRTRFSDQPCRM